MLTKTTYHSIVLLFCTFLATNSLDAQILESDVLGHEKWEYILEGSGEVLQPVQPISALSVTLIKGDFEDAKQFTYYYDSTKVLTYSLKRNIHKQRPEGRERYDSFPSGHTASAFSGASFMHRRYSMK